MRSTSLCKRLTATVTVVLAIGLTLLSVFSLVAIGQTLRTTLDSRLATTERAFVATASGRALNAALDERLLEVFGVQQNGALITRGGTILMESAHVPLPVIAAARTDLGPVPTLFTVGTGTALRGIAVRLKLSAGRQAVALLWRPLDVVDDYESIAAVIFALAGLSIVVITGLLMLRIMRGGLQPLRSIAAVASEIEAHDLSRRVAGAAWDLELQEVAATFDRMLDRLESAFQRQRQFTADASHELRAPVSVLRAEVDLALRRPRDPVADHDAFVSIREEVQALERLIDALLVAARADSGPLRLQRLDVADLWTRMVQRVKPFASAHNVTIGGAIRADRVVADPDILSGVLLTLLHNAVKFSPPGGNVCVNAERCGRSVRLEITDEGRGFSSAALRLAFDRFWRDDAARGRGGAGLGLAIAKAAMERMGGEISISNAESSGARVTLSLPLVEQHR